jgi:hypothetical protein
MTFPRDVPSRTYSAEPLPSSADDRLRDFVASEGAADDCTVLTPEAEWVLILFASRMASLAVREHSEAHVRAGLAALTLIQGQVDLRDAIIYVSILTMRRIESARTLMRSFAPLPVPADR